MRPSLEALCALFMENRRVVKAVFPWESTYLHPVCAAIFTDKRQKADEGRLKSCRTLLREATGPFSNFRSTAKAAILSMLAVSPQPEDRLDKALRVYTALKARFFGSVYLPVASLIIADSVDASRYDETVERARVLYTRMKKEHPFLTSEEDSVFAVLLALSPRADAEIIAETETCYRLLKPTFSSRNALQSLSHVLALGDGSAEEKCERTVSLYRSLRERGCKYGIYYELATLGVAALLPEDQEDTVLDDICAVDAWLSTQKGYGFFSIGRQQRLMHAVMLVTSDRLGVSDSAVLSTAALDATISLIVAQQAAMCAAIAASSAASASASSGGY